MYIVETHRGENRDNDTRRGLPMENESETIGGYAVPVDPMDLLQCDSCQ